MIVINIAEWIINLFMLGMTVITWAIAILLIGLLYSMSVRCLKNTNLWKRINKENE
tara:strand:+ start:2312 stop:2479 length:168 start_codon:yes stop_codon:yes gene_type:complete